MRQEKRKTARLTDVAKLAGVSPALVSRIVNNDPTLRVRAETRTAVNSAIEMLNYTPHFSARALRIARTGLLGVALHSVNDPIYVEMVDAAQAEAAKRNYSIILVGTNELTDRRDAFRELVMGRRVDGLLIHGGHGRAEHELQSLARGLPSVMFNVNRTPGLRTIRLDDTEGARIATEHLIKLGHKAIVYMGDEGATSERRYEGYKAALADGGLPAQPPVLAGASPDTSHDTTVRFLRSGGVATAFVAFSTTCAVGVHSGIVAAGRRVPDDLSLVSIQDAWLARHFNPPLTVVSLPFSTLGATAVSILIDQISDPDEGETIVDDTPPRLIVRGSTNAPH